MAVCCHGVYIIYPYSSPPPRLFLLLSSSICSMFTHLNHRYPHVCRLFLIGFGGYGSSGDGGDGEKVPNILITVKY